jgi:hypothetical protein
MAKATMPPPELLVSLPKLTLACLSNALARHLAVLSSSSLTLSTGNTLHCAVFNLVNASSVISVYANTVEMPQKLFSRSTNALFCSYVKLVLTMK